MLPQEGVTGVGFAAANVAAHFAILCAGRSTEQGMTDDEDAPRMNEFSDLQRRAQAAYDAGEWRDEQDRSDWWEAEAYDLAAQLDECRDELNAMNDGRRYSR